MRTTKTDYRKVERKKGNQSMMTIYFYRFFLCKSFYFLFAIVSAFFFCFLLISSICNYKHNYMLWACFRDMSRQETVGQRWLHTFLPTGFSLKYEGIACFRDRKFVCKINSFKLLKTVQKQQNNAILNRLLCTL